MKVSDSSNGVIHAEVTIEHLKERGLGLDSFLLNPKHTIDLVFEIFEDISYINEKDMSDNGFLVSTDVVSNGVCITIYLPHNISQQPYIINGEKYHLPPKPIGFMITEDEDYLGGLCECPSCTTARTNYYYHGIIPSNSNAPEVLDGQVDFYDMTDEPFDFVEVDIKYEEGDIIPSDHPLVKSESTGVQVIAPNDVIFRFRDIEQVVAVAKRLVDVFFEYINLYQYEKNYYVVYRETADDKNLVGDLSAVNIEHGGIRSGLTDIFLSEYGNLIAEDDAFEVITRYF